jgi:hypothetical protein
VPPGGRPGMDEHDATADAFGKTDDAERRDVHEQDQ